MKDTTGKVILSLLAGATAGIVAGLLLAPETGEETRSGLKKSAAKLGDDLNKLLKDGLSHLDAQQGTASSSGEGTTADRSAADDLLKSMGSIGASNSTVSTGAVFPEDIDSDYDGIGGDSRHFSGYNKGF